MVKDMPVNAGDLGLIPGLRRSPWRRKWQPTVYSCLENPTDRGAWQAGVQGVAKGRHNLATKQQQQKYLRRNLVVQFLFNAFFNLALSFIF